MGRTLLGHQSHTGSVALLADVIIQKAIYKVDTELASLIFSL